MTTTEPPRPGVDAGPDDLPSDQPRPFWGWRVVVAGALAQTLLAGLVQHAFTNYAVLLREEFGWSTTLIAAAFAMNRLETGLLGPLQGWLLDRFGPRFVTRVGAVLVWIGLMLFSTISNAFQFFAYFLIISIGASLAGFITVVTAVVQWFERRRSTALALAQAGFPVGGILTPVVVLSLTNFGWRATAFGSAWIVLVAVLALSFHLYGDPASVGQEVDGGPLPAPEPDTDGSTADRPGNGNGRGAPRGSYSPERDFTLAEAVRTRSFWMLNLGHATALLVVGSVMAHLSIYLTEEQGFTLEVAALVGTGLVLAQFVGQAAGGWFGDRWSKQYMVVAAMIGHVIGMLLFTFATAPWMIWAFVPFHGVAWGIRGPLMQAMRADYFGAGSFGRIMGWSTMIMMLGTMAGPLVVGFLRDLTGTYTLGLAVVTAGASLAIGFFLLAGRPELPDAAPTPDPAAR